MEISPSPSKRRAGGGEKKVKKYRMHTIVDEDDGTKTRVRIVELRGFDGYVIKFPRSCTGCYESEDGHPVGSYPIHPKHRVHIGSGCKECHYRGWYMDTEWMPIDYDAWSKAIDEKRAKEQDLVSEVPK